MVALCQYRQVGYLILKPNNGCESIIVGVYLLGAKNGFAPSVDFVVQSVDLGFVKFPRIAQSNLGWGTWYYQLLNKICGIGSAERVDVRQSACTQTGG